MGSILGVYKFTFCGSMTDCNIGKIRRELDSNG